YLSMIVLLVWESDQRADRLVDGAALASAEAPARSLVAERRRATAGSYAGLRRLGGRRASWLREVISSFRKTLCRWYCTVRGLMNSCAPISGLERPSWASRAIWASWGVSTPRVSSVRLRAVSPVAWSSRRARSA